MIMQVLLTVILVGLIVPFITLLLMGKRPVNPFKRGNVAASNSFDDMLACLRRIQAEIINTGNDDDNDRYVQFRFQGGNFYGVHAGNPQRSNFNTVAFSFFSCFETELENLAVLEHIVNETNNRNTPVKATFRPNEDNSKIDVSFHVSGLRITDSESDANYLIAIFSTIFDLQRLFIENFEQAVKEEPSALIQNSMPRIHSAYVMRRAELEENASTWSGPWFEMPPLTLAMIVDRLTGSVPSESAKIIVNGIPSDLKPSEFEPFKMMLKEDILADDPILGDYLSIDIIEPDELTNRSAHAIIRLKSVEERLITFHLYVMQSGLPVSPFRPIGSPETLPRAFSSTLGIHRGGPEMYKAEAEYMAQEQGLLDRIKSRDAAYATYWGQVLFTADRFFEASFYLQNAYDQIAPTMNDPANLPSETVELFFDICYFLGVSYYKLGRYRDSYYFLDIIVQQHRLRWTQQYILTLVALRDPRLESLLANIRNQLADQVDDEENGPHIKYLIQFIDRQMILVCIQQGKIDEARKALESRLESEPDDDFALYWLAKLG